LLLVAVSTRNVVVDDNGSAPMSDIAPTTISAPSILATSTVVSTAADTASLQTNQATEPAVEQAGGESQPGFVAESSDESEPNANAGRTAGTGGGDDLDSSSKMTVEGESDTDLSDGTFAEEAAETGGVAPEASDAANTGAAGGEADSAPAAAADSAPASDGSNDTFASMLVASPEATETPLPSPTPTATSTMTPTATATTTATPTPPPTATPMPTATPVALPSGGDSDRDGWEIAQLLLAIVLAALVVLFALTYRVRSRSR
jgi:hypothetical protein